MVKYEVKVLTVNIILTVMECSNDRFVTHKNENLVTVHNKCSKISRFKQLFLGNHSEFDR